jgi:hypothetical protein
MQRVKIEDQGLSPREVEHVQIASMLLERERWIVDDFAKKLGLRDYGIGTAKDLGAAVGINNEAVVALFGPHGDQGWKLERSATLLSKTSMTATDNTRLFMDIVLRMGTSSPLS